MRNLNIQTLRRIRSRQDENRFLSAYEPSTKAERGEAPRSSWSKTIYVRRFDRRVHCLSHGEFHAALLALHHPRLLDLHEQKMLHPEPAAHPAYGFPGYPGRNLRPVRGTLDVASRLNWLHLHPRVYVCDPDDGRRAPVAFPYQGDHLLFLRGFDNALNLVNWTVKETSEAFREPEPGSRKRCEQKQLKLYRRLTIERMYHADIGVPTVEVANIKLDEDMVNNLRAAFPYSQRQDFDIPNKNLQAILGIFRSAIQDGVTPTKVLAYLEQNGLCSIGEGKTIFYRSIWERTLRVDMFSPVVLDARVRPERQDIFDRYAHFFPGIPLPGTTAPSGS